LIEDQFMVVIPVFVGQGPAGRTPVFVGQVASKLIAGEAGPDVSTQIPGPEGYVVKIGLDRAVIAGCDYRVLCTACRPLFNWYTPGVTRASQSGRRASETGRFFPFAGFTSSYLERRCYLLRVGI